MSGYKTNELLVFNARSRLRRTPGHGAGGVSIHLEYLDASASSASDPTGSSVKVLRVPSKEKELTMTTLNSISDPSMESDRLSRRHGRRGWDSL